MFSTFTKLRGRATSSVVHPLSQTDVDLYIKPVRRTAFLVCMGILAWGALMFGIHQWIMEYQRECAAATTR